MECDFLLDIFTIYTSESFKSPSNLLRSIFIKLNIIFNIFSNNICLII